MPCDLLMQAVFTTSSYQIPAAAAAAVAAVCYQSRSNTRSICSMLTSTLDMHCVVSDAVVATMIREARCSLMIAYTLFMVCVLYTHLSANRLLQSMKHRAQHVAACVAFIVQHVKQLAASVLGYAQMCVTLATP